MKILCLLGIHSYEPKKALAGEYPEWIIFGAADYKVEYLRCSRCEKWIVVAKHIGEMKNLTQTTKNNKKVSKKQAC